MSDKKKAAKRRARKQREMANFTYKSAHNHASYVSGRRVQLVLSRQEA